MYRVHYHKWINTLPLLSLLRARPVSLDPHRRPRRNEVDWPTRSATFLVLVQIVDQGCVLLRHPPMPGDVWRKALQRRVKLRGGGCHVRISCHVKYFSQRGVEQPLIGCLDFNCLQRAIRKRSAMVLWWLQIVLKREIIELYLFWDFIIVVGCFKRYFINYIVYARHSIWHCIHSIK